MKLVVKTGAVVGATTAGVVGLILAGRFWLRRRKAAARGAGFQATEVTKGSAEAAGAAGLATGEAVPENESEREGRRSRRHRGRKKYLEDNIPAGQEDK